MPGAPSPPRDSASSRSRSRCGSSPRTTCPAAPRVYSPTYTLYVLNAEQHAIWLTEQLSKWHRQSLEVARPRDCSCTRSTSSSRLFPRRSWTSPTRASGSRTRPRPSHAANGRRLSGLVSNGEELVRQAMRNPEFGVGHLEKWAGDAPDPQGHRREPHAARSPTSSAAQALSVAWKSPWATRTKMAARCGPASGGRVEQPPNGRDQPPPDERDPLVADRESSQNSPAKPSDEKDDDSPSKPEIPEARAFVADDRAEW